MMSIKTYSELIKLSTFDERLAYLQLNGMVGSATFNGVRFLNQALYTSSEWRRTRHKIIMRDNGCDLGLEGYEMDGNILIHHMNPITIQDIQERSFKIFDPENLICVSHNTHNAIHYGTKNPSIGRCYVERTPNDTCPWKKEVNHVQA